MRLLYFGMPPVVRFVTSLFSDTRPISTECQDMVFWIIVLARSTSVLGIVVLSKHGKIVLSSFRVKGLVQC